MGFLKRGGTLGWGRFFFPLLKNSGILSFHEMGSTHLLWRLVRRACWRCRVIQGQGGMSYLLVYVGLAWW